MSDENDIYVLRVNDTNVGYVRCRDIAQWWAEQLDGRSWSKIEPQDFSDEEARKIVDAILKNAIVKKDEP